MKTNGKKSFLATTPSAVLALIAMFGVTVILIVVGEGLAPLFKINESIGEAVAYILYGIIIALCCYVIVKYNPGSVWYVPVICNLIGIISAIVEPNFWITPMWVFICGGWVLSIIGSLIGVQKGKKAIVNDNP